MRANLPLRDETMDRRDCHLRRPRQNGSWRHRDPNSWKDDRHSMGPAPRRDCRGNSSRSRLALLRIGSPPSKPGRRHPLPNFFPRPRREPSPRGASGQRTSSLGVSRARHEARDEAAIVSSCRTKILSTTISSLVQSHWRLRCGSKISIGTQAFSRLMMACPDLARRRRAKRRRRRNR